eukprot:358247-Chlamydomonas_euryale.AAC.3
MKSPTPHLPPASKAHSTAAPHLPPASQGAHVRTAVQHSSIGACAANAVPSTRTRPVYLLVCLC